jgi:CubicO group peptidase (beta-lactamase class C family)
MGAAAQQPPVMLSGGGGLVSTAGDYHRFTQMLLRGGELDGVRLLGRATVDYMTRNHLPGGAELEQMARPTFSETSFSGMGFGLGFSVVESPAENKVLSSSASSRGGAASTAFWVDPTGRSSSSSSPAAAVEHVQHPSPVQAARLPALVD